MNQQAATFYRRYIYRGYLQIAALDLTRSAHPALWFVTWDPTQPTATRPLAIQKDGTWFTYGYDITKNICELFGPAGYIRTSYSYAPFGSVSESENGVAQPFQWSSEHYDSELDLVYYNYRHYSPALGRFLSRDPIEEQGGLNLYAFVGNAVLHKFDVLGKKCCLITIHPRWFEKKDAKSWGGHSIFTCGEGESNVGSAYVSYFPKDDENKNPKHSLDEDAKKYGINFPTLPKDGGIQTTSKGFKVSQICFSTDCVNISKAVSYIQNVFKSENLDPWALFGNNCANNAAAAIAAGLPEQKKPRCNWLCEDVHDLLLTGVALALPTDLEANMKKLKANGCQRYVCRRKPQPPSRRETR